MKRQNKSKRGFTIIEVVLVLAIAGLIFAMVFIALPGLQRSQRDTQRTQDMARLITAIQNYEANNRGAIPKNDANNEVFVKGHTNPITASETTGEGNTTVKTNAPGRGTWEYFYDKYILVGESGATDSFADPSGDAYSLAVLHCNKSADVKPGDDCSHQRADISFDTQLSGAIESETAAAKPDNNLGYPEDATSTNPILVLHHATCNNEYAVYSAGARKIAVVYKKEGGGTICQQI